MEEQKCRNCIHYRRHYILDKERCTPVNCGHCIAVRIKKRKPDDTACDRFAYCDNAVNLPDRQEVIDFLSTEFLRRILEKTLSPMMEKDEGFDKIEEATSF